MNVIGQFKEQVLNNEAVYNIGVVARMTGIPENTLRVWERRYGFPKSFRTDGGHRLFSPHEVARIKWVKQQTDAGMQISNAIRALEQTEQNGLFPDFSSDAGIPSSNTSVDEASSNALQEHLFQALTQHDEMKANQVIREALASYSIEDLIFRVIAPLFTEIGEAWRNAQIDIATEHFATNHLRRQLLMWLQSAPPAYPVRPIVLACAPEELHEGGLIMLAVLLRRLRWPILYLGQSVDFPDLARFVKETNPALIVLVAMTEDTALTLNTWTEWLPNGEDSDLAVAYAGYVFTVHPDLHEHVSGLYLGDTLNEGLHTLDVLMHDHNPLLG
jgi:DNA-binding transcriptional MerR regulator